MPRERGGDGGGGGGRAIERERERGGGEREKMELGKSGIFRGRRVYKDNGACDWLANKAGR